MPRHTCLPLLTLALVLAACDRDPEQPRGGAWQPCLEDRRCSDESLSCLQVWGASDVTACLPECAMGDTCPASPVNENGIPTTTRCDADVNLGRCMIDCESDDSCPAGMLCFFDNAHTPITSLGICAWPPV